MVRRPCPATAAFPHKSSTALASRKAAPRSSPSRLLVSPRRPAQRGSMCCTCPLTPIPLKAWHGSTLAVGCADASSSPASSGSSCCGSAPRAGVHDGPRRSSSARQRPDGAFRTGDTREDDPDASRMSRVVNTAAPQDLEVSGCDRQPNGRTCRAAHRRRPVGTGGMPRRKHDNAHAFPRGGRTPRRRDGRPSRRLSASGG